MFEIWKVAVAFFFYVAYCSGCRVAIKSGM